MSIKVRLLQYIVHKDTHPAHKDTLKYDVAKNILGEIKFHLAIDVFPISMVRN